MCGRHSADLYSEQSEFQDLFQGIYEANMLAWMSRPILASPLLNFVVEEDPLAAENAYQADQNYISMCQSLETADFRREALEQFITGVLVAKSRHHSVSGVIASTKLATLRLMSFPGVTGYVEALKKNERVRTTAERELMKAFEFIVHKKPHALEQ